MQLQDAYSVLGIRQWATEPEVRGAWEKQQQNPQVYQAAEMIRQAGFPSGPPGAPGAAGPQYPFPPQQMQPQPGYPVGPQPYPQQPQAGYPIGPQPYAAPGQPPPAYPYPLAPQQNQYPPPPVEVATNHGGRQILVGLALLILGIAITAGTHSAASRGGGGTYIVAYGPIVVGVITLFKGIFNLSMGK